MRNSSIFDIQDHIVPLPMTTANVMYIKVIHELHASLSQLVAIVIHNITFICYPVQYLNTSIRRQRILEQ